jgi:hypothetical protein
MIGGDYMGSYRFLKNGLLSKVFLLILPVLLLTGCGLPGKLTFRSFASSMAHHDMKVVEQDRTGSKVTISSNWKEMGITAWKQAESDVNSLSLQYIEFENNDRAKTFFQTQCDYINTTTGAAGSIDGNLYTLTDQGFNYYLAYVDNKVVIATCQTKDIKILKAIIKKMPEVPKIDK